MSAESSQEPLKGSLLLASPVLNDPSFCRSVILITHHDVKRGTVGYVWNRPTGETIADISGDPSIPSGLASLPIYLGGPVNPQSISFCSFYAKEGELAYNVGLSMDDSLKQTKMPGRIVRAFAGCAKWEPGQLEDELNNLTWIRAQAKPSLLQAGGEARLWGEILTAMSPYHAVLAQASLKPYYN